MYVYIYIYVCVCVCVCVCAYLCRYRVNPEGAGAMGRNTAIGRSGPTRLTLNPVTLNPQAEVVRALLEAGARVDRAAQRGVTALHMAVLAGRTAATQVYTYIYTYIYYT